MRSLAFAKMEGAANDFVVLEGAPPAGPDAAKLVRSLCHRRRGIGGDGALWMQRLGGDEVFRMHFFNRDGNRVSLCLNGSRCVALRAVQLGWAEGRFCFATEHRVVSAEVHDDARVSLWLDPPRMIEHGIDLPAGSIAAAGSALDTGDPHLVVPVDPDDWNELEFEALARPLRHWDGDGKLPDGSNVHFVTLTTDPWSIRSFERGVEAETWACGSGCLATAAAYAEAKAVQLRTRGGDLIDLRPDGARWQLEGPARLVGTGEFQWDGNDVELD